MKYQRDIQKQKSRSVESGRGVGLFDIHHAKKELFCSHNRQCREIFKTFAVVRDYYFTTASNSTLVLHHIFKVADRSVCHRLLELSGIHRQYLNSTGCLLQTIVNYLSATAMKKVRHCSKSNWCNTITYNTLFPHVQQNGCFGAMLPIVDEIHQDVCVKEYTLRHFGLDLLSIYRVRSSESSSCVKLTGCSRNHLVSADSGTLNFLRAVATRSSDDIVFRDSSIDSVMNVTTICFCSRVMLSISSIYGAIGVSVIRCAVAVIILTFIGFTVQKYKIIFKLSSKRSDL